MVIETRRGCTKPKPEPFLYQPGKLVSGKMLKQLIEQAAYLYDCLALLVGDVWRKLRPRKTFADVQL